MVVQRVNRFLECFSDKDYSIIVYVENQVIGNLEVLYEGSTLGLRLDEDLFLIEIYHLGEKFVLVCAW